MSRNEERLEADKPSPRSIRLITALLLVATFAAGTVTGAGIHRWLVPAAPQRPPEPPPPGPLPLAELDLTAEQWTEARTILDRHRPALDAVLQSTYPRIREITAQIEGEVVEILTPSQRDKLAELKARRPPPPGPLGAGPPPPGPPGAGPPPPGPPGAGPAPFDGPPPGAR